MAAAQPLTGTELIDCAQANAAQGLSVAAQQCGYDDTETFLATLRSTCQAKGIAMETLQDLLTPHQVPSVTRGLEIAPDSASEL